MVGKDFLTKGKNQVLLLLFFSSFLNIFYTRIMFKKISQGSEKLENIIRKAIRLLVSKEEDAALARIEAVRKERRREKLLEKRKDKV